MESGERISGLREVPILDSAPPSSTRPFGRTHEPDESRHAGADIWAAAVSRLQTQVSLNTSLLESNRRQIQEVSARIDNLKQEMGGMSTMLHGFRMELRAKGSAVSGPHDSGDLDVLISQVEAVTAKVNEVDSMKLQLDLMKNRMKRFEDTSGDPAATISSRPGPPAPLSQREASMHDAPRPLQHASPYPLPLHDPPHHQPLPPMRTASMASSSYAPLTHPRPPALEAHGRPGFPPVMEPRHFSAESSTMHGSPIGGFRSSESLPPPSALTAGWRSSDSLPHLGGLSSAQQSTPQSHPAGTDPESHGSAWASVNAAQPVKRPYEEPRASTYESPGSPKRPKLASIMPRGPHADDPYAPSILGPSSTRDSSVHARSRAGSETSQAPSQVSSIPTSTGGPSYRFITSTSQADPHEGWRREHEGRRNHPHGHGHGHGHGGPLGPGRRGGRRGGRGGRRARGGGVIIGEPRAPGSPEWEQSAWAPGEVPPNGFHQHHAHPHSPIMGRGGGLGRRGGGFGPGPPDRKGEPPVTPSHGMDDSGRFAGEDGGQTTGSGGKKTRTKPIRNADGVLMRKDGRPDMRSVSSANNLRKVHAKKEAERAEMEGKPAASARSLAPLQAYPEEDKNADRASTSGSPQEGEGEEGGEEDDEEPGDHSYEQDEEQSAAPDAVAEPQSPSGDAAGAEMKTETKDQVGKENRSATDVEMSDEVQATGESTDQDTPMATAGESNDER